MSKTMTSKIAADRWSQSSADAPLGDRPGKDFPRMAGPRLLLRPRPVQEKTAGGVLLPQASQEAEEIATCVSKVIDIGPGAFTDDKALYPETDEGGAVKTWAGWRVPKVGDYVLTGKYAGSRVEFNNVKFIIVNDEEIMGYVDDLEGVRAFF